MLSHAVKLNLIIVIIILTLFLPWFKSDASRLDELREQISTSQSKKQQLEAEIKKYEAEIKATQQVSSGLRRDISGLEATKKKLNKDIELTQEKITATKLEIEQLSLGISDRQREIDQDRQALAEALRQYHYSQADSFLELALANNSLSAWLTPIGQLSQLSRSIDERVAQLNANKIVLENQKQESQQKEYKLSDYRADLSDKKQVAEVNQQEKDSLLKETQNKEANYQKLLADRKKKMEEVESEIQRYESEMRVIIDPNSLPTTGTGALAWPVDKVIITQYFGYTEFATKNPQVYSGKGHNGIDLGVSVGTPIKASRQGQVVGVGDTDTACPGASYGKWILIAHDNNLSTLYAHLSVIKVKAGQSVGLGEVIAYSGNTGYSTGPHLHFTVYASQGVKIGSLQSKVAGCGVYRLPLASTSAYLNPLSYLKSL